MEFGTACSDSDTNISSTWLAALRSALNIRGSMFWRVFWVPAISIFVIATGIIFSWPSVGRDVGSFEGTWEGKLHVVDSTASKDSDSYKRTKATHEESLFRITIRGQRADVYFGETEIKPSLFQAHTFMTNAVVFASNAGGQWVETWDFALTQKNSEALIVCFSRVVNNLDLAEEKDGSRFFVVAVGEFRRTSR